MIGILSIKRAPDKVALHTGQNSNFRIPTEKGGRAPGHMTQHPRSGSCEQQHGGLVTQLRSNRAAHINDQLEWRSVTESTNAPTGHALSRAMVPSSITGPINATIILRPGFAGGNKDSPDDIPTNPERLRCWASIPIG
jgi:hypothetical protein